jgi:hypothetical protein
MRLGANIRLGGAMNGGITPHPVPLPLGEGTPSQRAQPDSLSQGERAGVRGDAPVMLAPTPLLPGSRASTALVTIPHNAHSPAISAEPQRHRTRLTNRHAQREQTLDFCAAQYTLVQCGMRSLRVSPALLGRFLPRLGPLNHFGWPFFCACTRLAIQPLHAAA